MPGERLLTEMGDFNEQLAKAGVLLAGEGLHPSSKGARVYFSGDKRTVVDGPFTETKELIAGFWLWEVRSMEEALEWVKRCPNPMEGDSEIEVRQVFETSDFAVDSITEQQVIDQCFDIGALCELAQVPVRRAQSVADLAQPPVQADVALAEAGAGEFHLGEQRQDLVLAEALGGAHAVASSSAGPISRWLLKHRRTKHYMRSMYALRSLWQLKRGLSRGDEKNDYWQAGKSVGSIESIESAGAIVTRFATAARAGRLAASG